MSLHALTMSVAVVLVTWVGCKMTRGLGKDIEALGDAMTRKELEIT
jgi:predicted small secreted protein